MTINEINGRDRPAPSYTCDTGTHAHTLLEMWCKPSGGETALTVGTDTVILLLGWQDATKHVKSSHIHYLCVVGQDSRHSLTLSHTVINNFSTNEATVTMQCALTRQPNTLSASLSAYADTLGAFHRRHCRRALSYITTPKTMIYCLQTVNKNVKPNSKWLTTRVV